MTTNFKTVNVYSFTKPVVKKINGENVVLIDRAKLFSGFDIGSGNHCTPCYRIASKTIPITGEFTGFPVSVMIEWFKSMGFEYVGSSNVADYNKFKQV